jgi:hypothetical protein
MSCPENTTGKLCGLCGGPHQFDTSVPSQAWNRAIRSRGIPEYLCLSCIVVEFAKAGESFSAILWGDDLDGIRISIGMA